MARYERAQKKTSLEQPQCAVDSNSNPSTSVGDSSGLCDRAAVCDGETQTELNTKDIDVLLRENAAMKQRLADMEHSS